MTTKFLTQWLPWRLILSLSVIVLVLLVGFSFYGLYTNKFYFFKIDNYLFPLLSIVHFVFLYAMWFKIKEGEHTDRQMRNLEYMLYFIFFAYLYKALETYWILVTQGDYELHILPHTFLPVGVTLFVLQILLLFLTPMTFLHRKYGIGNYRFDDINRYIDSWEE